MKWPAWVGELVRWPDRYYHQLLVKTMEERIAYSEAWRACRALVQVLKPERFALYRADIGGLARLRAPYVSINQYHTALITLNRLVGEEARLTLEWGSLGNREHLADAFFLTIDGCYQPVLPEIVTWKKGVVALCEWREAIETQEPGVQAFNARLLIPFFSLLKETLLDLIALQEQL